MSEQILLIAGIFASYILVTLVMYKRFYATSRDTALRYERHELTLIFIIGIITAGVGNVFKNPFTDRDLWLVAKNSVLIVLAMQIIILLINGIYIDRLHKKIPHWLITLTNGISGLIALGSATIIMYQDHDVIVAASQILGIIFMALTAAFLITLITSVVLRIIHRTD